MKRQFYLIFSLILFIAIITFAQEQTNSNLPSKIKISFSERYRLVMWDNAIDLNDKGGNNQNFSRY
ncbi:MAG: hypothetical protein M0P71_13570 [Melioribacteraceae bacterium]|nr:hypothetical protein [Melioribacteraceae bacterium]